MEDTERYISLLNFHRFSDQLLTDCDSVTRSTVTKLLIAEEDRLGSTYEQLDRTLRHIQRCCAVIERQAALILRLQENGHDVSTAEAVRSSFLKTKALYEERAATIRRELANSRAQHLGPDRPEAALEHPGGHIRREQA